MLRLQCSWGCLNWQAMYLCINGKRVQRNIHFINIIQQYKHYLPCRNSVYGPKTRFAGRRLYGLIGDGFNSNLF